MCHGKHLRQYHEEREGKQIKMQEYFLGKYTRSMFDELVEEHKKDVSNGITRHPPTKMIEKTAMPYYEISMTEAGPDNVKLRLTICSQGDFRNE